MKEAVGSQSPVPPPGIIRFGNFEVDTRAGELRRSGIKLKLSGQPFDVLLALLEKPGQVVTREELHDKLWSQDTFVDFEHGLNKAINKLRDALGDDANTPRFIETVPRRGYRFLARVVTPVPSDAAAVENHPILGPQEKPAAPAPLLPLPAPRPRPRVAFWLAAGAVAILAVVIAAVIFVSIPPPPPRVLRYTQLTNDGLKKIGVLMTALTTDGSRIYFGEQNAQGLGTVAEVSVNGGTVTTLAKWSDPNQLELDYSPARSQLLLGGEVQSPIWALSVPGDSTLRRIGDFLVDGASWSPDGQSILYGKVNALYTANADGSGSRKLVTVNGDPESPRWSPDGKTLRFTLNPWEAGQQSLWEASADGSNLHPLFPDYQSRADSGGFWTPDGKYFVFVSYGKIMALREKKNFLRKPQPQPVTLTAGPLNFSGAVLSSDGRKIFTGGRLDRGELLRHDPQRNAWEPFLSGISAADLDFSRDGEWVTYVLVPDGTLWRSRVDGSERLQLTAPPFRAAMPRWSPDTKQIAFVGLTSGLKWSIFLVPADGGRIDRLVNESGSFGDPNWSADGTRLVYGETTWSPKSIRILDLQSRRISELPRSSGLFSPRWSPDGRYIIAVTTGLPPWQTPDLQNPQQQQLMRFDLDRKQWTKLAESGMIAYPSFSRNGSYVYFQAADQRICRVKDGDSKMEVVAHIDVPGGMKKDDFWYWTGLAPDDAPLTLRDASTEELYSLDVDFP